MPERIALLSDIHGNAPALRHVLADVAGQGCERIFVLGDTINGMAGHDCLDLLRRLDNLVCLQGNAEMYTLTPDLADFPLRHEPLYADLIQLVHWFEVHLSVPDMEWIRTFPEDLTWNGACLVHDSPLDRLLARQSRPPEIDAKYQEFIFHGNGISPRTPQAEIAKVAAWMADQGLSAVFCGHTHEPCVREVTGRLIANAGSVGMPLDGDPRPSWLLLEKSTTGVPTVSIRRVAYNMGEILSLIDQTPDYPNFAEPGVKQAYKRSMQTGIHWTRHMKQ